MQPKNKAERKRAYVNFMLFFLLCTAIIVVTVISGASVPLKENNQLRESQRSAEKKNAFKNDFTEKMILVSNTINTLDKTNQAEYLSKTTDAEKGISELTMMIPADENDDKKLYTTIASCLRLYLVAKNKADDNVNSNAEVTNLKAQLKAEEDKSQKYHDELYDCKYGNKPKQ